MPRLYAGLGLVGGLIMVIASFAHALAGWPAHVDPLKQASVNPDIVDSLQIGWHWGSFCMFATGCAVLVEAIRAFRGITPHRPVVLVIGALYLAFGAWAYIKSEQSPHFFGFMFAGALALALLFVHPWNVNTQLQQ